MTRYDSHNTIVSIFYSDTRKVWTSGILKSFDKFACRILCDKGPFKGEIINWISPCTIRGEYPINTFIPKNARRLSDE